MAISESFKQQCPSCEAKVTIKGPSLIGKKVECPRCKYRFVVEDPAKAKKDSAADETVASKSKETKRKGKAVEDDELMEAEEDEATPAKGRGKGEPKDSKSKKKKAGGSNTKLLIGAGLAVVGVLVLSASAYFVFFSGGPETPKKVAKGGGQPAKSNPGSDEPTDPDPNIPADPKDKGKGKGTGKDKGTPDTAGAKGEPAGIENTNFLPRNSEAVFHSRFKDLLDSSLGQAAIGKSGSALDKEFKDKLGISVVTVDDLLVAENYSEKWIFHVVHTTQVIKDMRQLVQALGLEDWPGNTTKHKCYEVKRNAAWPMALAKLSMFLPSYALTHRGLDPKAGPVLFHLRDSQTLIFANPQPMLAYLRANGKIEPTKGGGKKSEESGAYMTVSPPLREMLLHNDPKSGGSKELFSSATNQRAAGISGSGADGADGLTSSAPVLKDIFSILLNKKDKIDFVGMSAVAPDRTTLIIQNSFTCSSEAETMQLQKELAAKAPSLVQYNDKNIDIGIELNLSPELLNAMKSAVQLVALSAKAEAEAASGVDLRFPLGAAGKTLGEKGITKRGVPPGKYPPAAFPRPVIGSWSARDPSNRVSWMAGLLPYMGHESLFNQIQFDQSWREGTNALTAATIVPQFIDSTFPPQSRQVAYPGMPMPLAATHYVGIAGVGHDAADALADDPAMTGKLGVFGYNRMTDLKTIQDKGRGLGNTVLMIRVPHDGPAGVTPWMAGGGSTVRNVPDKNSLAPFLSHDGKDAKDGKGGGSTYVLMADGSVRLLKQGMSDEVFKAICTVDGPKPPDWKFDEDSPPLPAPKPPPPPKILKDPIPVPPGTGGGGGPIVAKGGGGGGDPKSPTAGWQQFTQKDSGFTITMPGSTKPITDKSTDIKYEALKAQDEQGRLLYWAGAGKFPTPPNKNVFDQIYDSVRDDKLGENGARPSAEKQLTLGNYTGKEYTMEYKGPKGSETHYARVYIVDSWVYVLIANSPGINPSAPEFTSFFGSFRPANVK